GLLGAATATDGAASASPPASIQPAPLQPAPLRLRSPAQALAEVDALLAEPLVAASCDRLAALTAEVPGRARAIVRALAEARHGAAVDALLRLPPSAPGVVEAVYQAIRLGVRRELGGALCAEHLALEFRGSRARAFPDLLARALAAFPALERLEVDGERCYRITIGPEPERRALRRLVSGHEGDLLYLHGRLGRLRGTRLWINGWCLPADGPWTPAHQVHWIRAWLDRATADEA
ncbi:MAG: hypothetical protein R3B09_33830, partial [Nannocystaceae bacterium]